MGISNTKQQQGESTTTVSPKSAANNNKRHSGVPKQQEDEMLLWGVSVKWFMEEVAAREETKREGFKTSDFLEAVKEMTTNESVVEYLRKTKPLAVKDKADVFISHAWKYDLKDLIESLKTFLENEKRDDLFIWLDVLCVNQHKAGEGAYKDNFWYDTFHDAINKIGHTVVILTPWDNPTNLTRSWCLWELYGSTRDANTIVEVVIVPTQRNHFREALRNNFSDLLERIGKIDVSKAEAFKPEDRDKILKAAKKAPGGIRSVQEKAVGPLRKWMANEAGVIIEDLEARLAQETDENNHAALIKETADFSLRVGVLLTQQRCWEKAEKHLRRSLELRKKIHGGNIDIDIAHAKNDLAEAIQALGKLDEAKELFEDALKITIEKRGENNADVAAIEVNLGSLYHKLGKNEEAEQSLRKALAILEHTFKPDSPELTTAMINLALFLSERNPSEAMELYEKALAIDENCRPDSSELATSKFDLANLLFNQKDYSRAAELFTAALDIDRRTFGDTDPKVYYSSRFLGRAYSEMGSFDKAMEYFGQALAVAKEPEAKLGPLVTAQAYFDLGRALCNLSRGKDAIENLEKAKEIFEKEIGKDCVNAKETKAWIFLSSGKQREAHKIFDSLNSPT